MLPTINSKYTGNILTLQDSAQNEDSKSSKKMHSMVNTGWTPAMKGVFINFSLGLMCSLMAHKYVEGLVRIYHLAHYHEHAF